MICAHVFGLDEAFEYATSSLKRNMMTSIHRKEFSTEVTEGLEPSLILVIPDVICEACQVNTDLDICRENFFNFSALEDREEINSEWKCRNCDSELNKVLIERRLIELLNRRLVTY